MKTRFHLFISLLIFLVGGLTGNAVASLVTYEFGGTMSGSLNGVAFTDEMFTIEVLADTTNITTDPDGFSVASNSSTFTFPGFSGGTTVTVTPTSTSVFVNNTNSLIGFSNETIMNDLLFLNNPAFATYDLSTSIGPLSSAPPSIISQFGTPMSTTGGELLADDNFTASLTFTATVVPTPSAMLLFGTGLAAMVGWNFRSKKRS